MKLIVIVLLVQNFWISSVVADKDTKETDSHSISVRDVGQDYSNYKKSYYSSSSSSSNVPNVAVSTKETTSTDSAPSPLYHPAFGVGDSTLWTNSGKSYSSYGQSYLPPSSASYFGNAANSGGLATPLLMGQSTDQVYQSAGQPDFSSISGQQSLSTANLYPLYGSQTSFPSTSYPSTSFPTSISAQSAFPDTAFYSGQSSYGIQPNSLSLPQNSLGISQSTFSFPQSSLGVSQGAYALPQSSVGASQSTFAFPQSSLGISQSSLALPQSSFALPQTSSFSVPQTGSYSFPQTSGSLQQSYLSLPLNPSSFPSATFSSSTNPVSLSYSPQAPSYSSPAIYPSIPTSFAGLFPSSGQSSFGASASPCQSWSQPPPVSPCLQY